jgi:hypothetical protein
MEFDFLSFILGITVGLFIAYSIVRILGRLLYNKLVAEGVIQSAKEEVEKERIEMKVSKIGDIYYAHRTDTDDFICQGTDLSELKRKFADRFPGHDGSVVGVSEETHAELIKQKEALAKTS